MFSGLGWFLKLVFRACWVWGLFQIIRVARSKDTSTQRKARTIAGMSFPLHQHSHRIHMGWSWPISPSKLQFLCPWKWEEGTRIMFSFSCCYTQVHLANYGMCLLGQCQVSFQSARSSCEDLFWWTASPHEVEPAGKLWNGMCHLHWDLETPSVFALRYEDVFAELC